MASSIQGGRLSESRESVRDSGGPTSPGIDSASHGCALVHVLVADCQVGGSSEQRKPNVNSLDQTEMLVKSLWVVKSTDCCKLLCVDA